MPPAMKTMCLLGVLAAWPLNVQAFPPMCHLPPWWKHGRGLASSPNSEPTCAEDDEPDENLFLQTVKEMHVTNNQEVAPQAYVESDTVTESSIGSNLLEHDLSKKARAQGWVNGTRVGSAGKDFCFAGKNKFKNSFANMADAESECELDSECTFIWSWQCNGKWWKCYESVPADDNIGDGSSCTRVKSKFPRLRVEGNQIFDHEDKVWIGKGMNWGRHSNLYLYNESDAGAMKALLPWVNHIRVVFKWHTGLDVAYEGYDPNGADNGYLTQAIRTYIDDIVSWATSAEIWVTLTMTYNGGVMHLEEPYNQNDCTPFVTDQTWREEHQAMWQYLVKKYAETPYIAFVEPWSEAKMGGCSDDQAAEWMNELVAKIHEVEPDMPVALAADYNQCHGPDHWTKLQSNKIIYPINYWCPAGGYGQEMSCSTAWGKSDWARECLSDCKDNRNAMTTPSKQDYEGLMSKALRKMEELDINAPIWVDQWGCNYDKVGTTDWITDFAELFTKQGWSSSWWSWKGPCNMCVVGPTVDCEDGQERASAGYNSKYECKTTLERFTQKDLLVAALNSAFDQ